ncbi:LytR/AlgR family response regulator transcription factor [Aurantibacillus circumpalustris]|uniref:LytR/AlgR family response regulator transcription factor n=1 Tax=Aurantibacillus circumpalustris TaxID=3036359 RepID=UPI00295B8747|nr:LytTR family DNA-binding domain-containing protein [Aurantibacillus circumpalustris]
MKLRSLIVDDEIHARENLKFLLKNYCPEIEVIGTASNEETARESVKLLNPQVIFLDICMPSGTEGFDFLESLPNKKFQVVFVTAFKEYAIRALNANAIHYLMKPVDVDDLKMAVEKLIATNHLFNENHEQLSIYIKSLENLSRSMLPPEALPRITINHAKGFKIVDPNDFMYLEGEGNYTSIIFTDGTKYLDTKSIGIYEGILDPKHFFRIHKSHIVNILFVKEFLNDDGHFVIMKNNAKLGISRLRAPQFLAFFKTGKKSSSI